MGKVGPMGEGGQVNGSVRAEVLLELRIVRCSVETQQVLSKHGAAIKARANNVHSIMDNAEHTGSCDHLEACRANMVVQAALNPKLAVHNWRARHHLDLP